MVLLVEVEDRRIKKPYLGGWRHKVTRTEYLNGDSQTGPPPERVRPRDACSRAVQTVETKDANVQAPRHRATQMWRPDCNVSNESDAYVTSKPYETYDEMQARLDFDGNARIIQRNYRVYRLLKYLKESAQKYRELLEDCRKHEEERALMSRKRHKEEILRKIYPRTKMDFDVLYEMIEKWRKDRLNATRQRFFGAARCAENYAILETTVEMFRVIDEKKLALSKERRRKGRVNFLTLNCRPIRWNGYRGKLVEMVTMKTQRAREFKDIYDSLVNHRGASRVDRLELLIMLKKSVEAHNCVASFNLLYLLEQEIGLLERGIRGLRLDYLRERITYGYLCFLRRADDCGCEGGKKNSGEELRGPSKLGTKLCRSCLKLLPCYRFAVHGRMKKLSTCINCNWLSQRNFAHVNYSPYLFILNCVRAEERRKRCFSALSFMMQAHDVYHLVNNIWHGRSIVSQNDDIFVLRLVRYNIHEEWSPWNCILLTEDEAEVHCKIRDLSTVYSKHFIDRVLLAHQLAKNHFQQLSTFETDFRESSGFCTIQDRIDYVPPSDLTSYYF